MSLNEDSLLFDDNIEKAYDITVSAFNKRLLPQIQEAINNHKVLESPTTTAKLCELRLRAYDFLGGRVELQIGRWLDEWEINGIGLAPPLIEKYSTKCGAYQAVVHILRDYASLPVPYLPGDMQGIVLARDVQRSYSKLTKSIRTNLNISSPSEDIIV